MAGIYIHIPFCKKACNYCNFHFSTSTRLYSQFLEALLSEIELRKNYLTNSVSTIYFGGGTPSIIPFAGIQIILQKIRDTFVIEDDAEITLEANPDDISQNKLDEWNSIGINRLSIGVQSFYQEDLSWMNRAHSADQAKNCIILAREAGFHNLSIDLIYGTPTLSLTHWENNVATALQLKVPHLACYALTVEPKTALENLIAQKKLQDISNDTQAVHFERLMDWMNAAGYEHYEISNFAMPGWRSKHNSSYWQGKSYLGLGPSAHSFDGHSRQWNIANNALYISSLKEGTLNYEKEQLTKEQQLNEYIMTSLRTIEGLSLQIVQKSFGAKARDSIMKTAMIYINQKLLVMESDHLITTTSGKLLADGIASHLFI